MDYEKIIRAYMRQVLGWEGITYTDWHWDDDKELRLTDDEYRYLCHIGKEEQERYDQRWE